MAHMRGLRACEFILPWLPPSGGSCELASFFRLKPEATQWISSQALSARLIWTVTIWSMMAATAAAQPTRPAAAARPPNVLLIILDTVRGLEVGFGGYQRATTPNMDRWAARGVVFDRLFDEGS